jgi:hypothetical protein
LYKNQAITIYVNGHKEEAKIRQGVRQGCPLSPYLFNLFIEEAIKEMKVNINGISINDQKIRSIRLADDIALMVESTGDLNLMLNCLDTILTTFRLKINIKKTKVFVVSKSDQQNAANIMIKNESVE